MPAPGGATDEAYVFVANEPLSSVSKELWNADPAKLLAKSPRDAHYVIMSYAATNKAVLEDIGKMQAKFETAIASLSDDAARDYWTTHVHYVTENPLDLDAPVADLLRAGATCSRGCVPSGTRTVNRAGSRRGARRTRAGPGRWPTPEPSPGR